MRRSYWLAALCLAAGAVPLFASPAPTAHASYTGTLAGDDDQRVVYFSLTSPGTVTLQTLGYGGGTNAAGAVIPAGGFDPTLTVFDGAGNLLVQDQDGCGTGANDPVTGFCWDSHLSINLPAGNYYVVVTQSLNLANGPAIGNSFVYQGQPTFTTPPGETNAGFWDLFPSKRTANYALDVIGANSLATTITSSATLPQGITGRTYTPFPLTANTGADATLTWSVLSGTLPAGLVLNPSTGAISGTPTAPGGYSFTVQATDGIQPVTQAVSLNVVSPVSITTSSLPAGVTGQTYGPITLGAIGGTGNYTWTVGGLPAGLSQTGAQIGGIPATGGTFQVAIGVYDSGSGLSASVYLTLTIAYAPLTITSNTNLGVFAPGARISGTLAAIGGVAPYKWSGSVPAGMSLNSATGAFSGTATTTGPHSFAIQVTDSEGTPASASANITYSVLGFLTTTLPNGLAAAPYGATIAATGGTAPYTFTATGLPAGITLSAAGVFGGTPVNTGQTDFFVQVTDANGVSTTAPFEIAVTGAASPLQVPGGTLISGMVGAAYSAEVEATGGTAPYSWSVLGGVLPTGVSLNSSGVVQGVPNAPGTFGLTAQVTDSTGATATGAFQLTISPAALTLMPGTLPDGAVGIPYPAQILQAAGGLAPYSFAVTSGSLPAGLSLNGPQISGIPTGGSSAFAITVTDSAGTTATVSFSIQINAVPSGLLLSQTTIPFSIVAGQSALPASANVTVRSTAVANLLAYTVTQAQAAPWLNVSTDNNTPGAIRIQVNAAASALPAAATPYTAAIVVNCTDSKCAGGPPSQTISVALTVTAPPAQLTIGSNLLSFTANTSNPVVSSQGLGLQNAGGGAIAINSITAADPWVTIQNYAPGLTLTAGAPVSIGVSVNPAGFAAGYYRSSVVINSSAGTYTVPVTLLVSGNLTMTLGPSGAVFAAAAGSAPGGATGSFNVIANGSGTLNWTAQVLPGATWLTVSAPSGTATAGAAGTVAYALNVPVVESLAQGNYYGTIQVSSANADDTPQNYEVVLSVTAPNSAITPELSPSGLLFISSAAATTPAQNVTVYEGSATASPYQATALSTDGAKWLSVSPATGTASGGAPATSSVSVNPGSLAPGVYTGHVNYSFSGGAIATANVTLVVLNAASCAPTGIIATQTGPADNFIETAGWPVSVSIHLSDSCGAPVNGAQAVATFSDNDQPLTLTPVDGVSGNYVATWTPLHIGQQVAVTVMASNGTYPAASAVVTGEVLTGSAPILAEDGTVNAFNRILGAGVAPGEVVEIYGTGMAGQVLPATAVPLPFNIGGTSVTIGGIPAPLFYVSAGQIDAQVPYELAPGNAYQVEVSDNGAMAAPVSVFVVPLAPGVATTIAGTVVAQHAADYSLVSETSPAKPGEYVILYLDGLGVPDQPIATGAPAPFSPLLHPGVTPTVTLNGVTVPFSFAGLTPGAIGLYQINLQIPANAPNGDLLLSVSQDGVNSNVAILPVHQ